MKRRAMYTSEEQDKGCSLYPSCLNCPLPECRFDTEIKRRHKKEERNREICMGHKQGKSVAELASEFGLSTTTIREILRKQSGTEVS